MHIPDNYLSPSTCAVMGAAVAPVWAVAVKKVKEEITREKLPMLGVGAAFTFLLMMFKRSVARWHNGTRRWRNVDRVFVGTLCRMYLCYHCAFASGDALWRRRHFILRC